jgi:hypothetical protein
VRFRVTALLSLFAALALLLVPAESEGVGRRGWRKSRGIRYSTTMPTREAKPSVAPYRRLGSVSAFSAGTGIPDPSANQTSITFYGAYQGAPAATNDAAIAACITANMAVQQYLVTIPGGGSFAISDSVELPRGMTLRGEAGQESVLDMEDDMAVPAVKALARCRVQDLKIIGHTTAGSGIAGSVGVSYVGDGAGGGDLAFPSGYLLENVHVRNVQHGFQFEWTGAGAISSCEVWDSDNGYHLTGDQVNSLNFYGVRALRCSNGVLCDATLANQINFWGGTFEQSPDGYGMQFDNATGGARNIRIEGCYFERNDVADVYCTSTSPGVENLRAVGNFHYDFAIAYKIDRCDHGVIEGHHFQIAGVSVTTEKTVELGASARYMKIGVSRHRPTGSSIISTAAANDLGENNEWDNTPRNWNISGDGTTDVTAELQAWIAGNPTHAHLPAGTYITNGEITALTDQLVTGDGFNDSIIKGKAAYAGVVMRYGDRTTVRDLGLLGVDVVGSTGLQATANSTGALFERVQLRDFANGAKIDNANSNVAFRDCLIRLNSNGVLISSGSGTPDRLLFDNNVFDSNVIGIYASGSTRAMSLLGNTFSNGTTYGVYLEGNSLGGVLHGNHFTTNGTADLRLAGASRGFHVTGNRCDTTTTSFILNCLESTFTGNVLNPGTTTITLGSSVDCEFGPNRFSAGTPALGPALVTDTRNTYLGKYYGSVAPAAGTWLKGDFVWNDDPDSADAIGWGCSAAGTPGTWIDGPVYQ